MIKPPTKFQALVLIFTERMHWYQIHRNLFERWCVR